MRLPRPRKAFVLAAGFGTRMLPLSRDLPKPLMPLWGESILLRVLRMLRRWGVRDVLINVHHQAGAVLDFVRRNPVPGLRLDVSFEPDILGTGGALRRAQWFFDDHPFWLVNADIAIELNPAPLLKAFSSGRVLAALWVHPSRGPRTVEVRRGFVRHFQSERPGASGTFTFCGLHLVSPRVLRYLPETGFAGIIPAYERAMRQGKRIAGVCVPRSSWADLGSPRQYLDAHREWSGRPGPFAAIGRGVLRGRNVIVKDSVVWDGAILHTGAHLERAIVGRGAIVRGHVTGLIMRADDGLDPAEQAALRRADWDPAETTIQPLGPRGSARTYTRLTCGAATMILMRYTAEREENALFCAHARLLADIGLRVPRVFLDAPRERLALLEDLGDLSLEHWLRGKPEPELRRMYRKILDDALRLHTRGTAAVRRSRMRLMPPFSKSLYRWEHDLFVGQFLEKRLGLSPREIRPIRQELASVSARLLRAPRVLIHRDLQSSNLLLVEGRPAFIDFQGMRLGTAAYDLASLLCDPYVSLPEALQADLLAHYARRSGREQDLFWPAAVQRLAQALGAYARLSALPGLQSFSRHIAPAARQLQRAANRCGNLSALASFAARAAIDTP